MAAVAATTLLIAACGGDGETASMQPAKQTSNKASGENKRKPAAAKPPSDSELLNKMLTERAYAIHTGDEAAFLKTSTGAQVAKDKRAISAAKLLPLNDVKIEAGGTEIDGDKGTLRVHMAYRFDGVGEWYWKTSRMSVEKTEDGWKVAKDRPSSGTLAPWEHTRYKARTSKHFLALAPATMKVGKLMRDLEKGRTTMRRGLKGVKLPDRVLVIVNRNSNDTKALTKDYKTLSAVVAIAEAQVSTDGPARKVSEVSGNRVFVLWRSYGNRPPKARQRVIAHELAHVALVKRTGGRVPVWLSEGTAMYASGDTNRASDAGALLSGGVLRDSSKQKPAERALSLSRLAKPNSMNRMSSISISFAYSYSAAAAYAIANKYGQGALLRLHAAFNNEKIKGKPGRALTNKVFKKVLKKSLSQVEAEVEAYARTKSPF
ncbi:hypothetical protein OJ997_13910 [Solirubrobacter phytolaccae]|uniref:Peptidase MA-like domain-containing protein n=1 Tax=Solirubrobacter phytolaccae TaxID=1404360 RepID=A0A9X3NAL0_9ACTN|nr:hypothetical protein [Solirubrobacter phytolaccae]MDA0181395.1 hypothetical protein [Solirubrobacter phytolaccae]